MLPKLQQMLKMEYCPYSTFSPTPRSKKLAGIMYSHRLDTRTNNENRWFEIMKFKIPLEFLEPSNIIPLTSVSD